MIGFDVTLVSETNGEVEFVNVEAKWSSPKFSDDEFVRSVTSSGTRGRSSLPGMNAGAGTGAGAAILLFMTACLRKSDKPAIAPRVGRLQFFWKGEQSFFFQINSKTLILRKKNS